ncbi:MAG: hypothetical protein JNJ58_14075 [Chitinophagaceae bacterium]|nr:hypothetical protein [Chitinophagaceae bacterium]
MKFYQRKTFWFIFMISFSVILARYIKIDMNDAGFGKGWYFGDAFSERNVQSAARFYEDKGFKPNCGLPMYGYEDSIEANETVYTHYPPLAEWIGGVISTTFKATSDHALSLFPLLLSVLLFFLIFKILAEIIGDDHISFVGASVLVLSNYFICWADDIHQHLYIELCRWSFVYLWWKYLKAPQRPYFILPILCMLYAAMCLLSFEPYVYTAIITVGFSWVLSGRIFRWENVLLLAVPVFAFALRLNLNANYLGGFDAMIADMKGAFINRTGGESGSSELGRAMGLRDYLGLLPKTRIHRLGHFYIFPSLVLFMLGILGLLRIRRYDDQLFRLSIVIYLACVSWIFVMPQHALIHIFTLRHMGIFMGLVLGFGLIAYVQLLKQHFSEKKYVFIGLHSLVILYSIFYAGLNTVYFVYLKYGYLYPHWGTDNYEVIDHFLF